MLRNFRIFSDQSLKDSAIEKIFKYMDPKEFVRGQVVFKEGQTNIDGVYFVTGGEFEVTTRIRPRSVEKNMNQKVNADILSKISSIEKRAENIKLSVFSRDQLEL